MKRHESWDDYLTNPCDDCPYRENQQSRPPVWVFIFIWGIAALASYAVIK